MILIKTKLDIGKLINNSFIDNIPIRSITAKELENVDINQYDIIYTDETVIVEEVDFSDIVNNLDILFGRDKTVNVSEINPIVIDSNIEEVTDSNIVYLVAQYIDKHFRDMLTESNHLKEVENVAKLFTSIKKLKNKNLMIVNGNIASIIQCSPLYKNQYDLVDSKGCCYCIGKYLDYEIYVNPYMRWDDDRVFVLKGGFFNFKFIKKDYGNHKIGDLYIEQQKLDFVTYSIKNVD